MSFHAFCKDISKNKFLGIRLTFDIGTFPSLLWHDYESKTTTNES